MQSIRSERISVNVIDSKKPIGEAIPFFNGKAKN
jgi:hypothetical protein